MIENKLIQFGEAKEGVILDIYDITDPMHLLD